MMRALKDKLPSGQYVMLVTLYDRLGGHALHWTAWDPDSGDEAVQVKSSNAKRASRKRHRSTIFESVAAGRQHSIPTPIHDRVDRPNVTHPFHHRGRFFNTDVTINQNLFMVGPPQSQLRPGNVLVFELFLLESRGGAGHHHGGRRGSVQDQIVAWGAMPLMTPDFQYVEGKYKIPFLRGEMDATMDKYRDIEGMYSLDLSAWLCNFYFQVTVMREDMERLIMSTERVSNSYDIEIDERNAVYRLGTTMECRPDSQAQSEIRRVRKKSVAADAGGDDMRDKPGGSTTVSAVQGMSDSATILIDDSLDSTASSGKSPGARQTGLFGGRLWPQRKTSNRVYVGSVVAPQLEEAEDTHDDEETNHTGTSLMKQGVPMGSSARELGLGSFAPSDTFPAKPADSADEELEERNLETPGRLDVENYSYSVNSAFARETAHHQRFHSTRKLHYLRHELLMDMGVSKIHTMEFWLLLALLAFALWLRVYIHYVMQWIFLKGQRIPVFYFRPQWTTCMIKYTWKSVATHTEIGVIVFGVLGNWLLFGFLAVSAFVSQSFVGELPHFGSKFIVCVGLATVLDPFLVLLVDVVNHQYACSTRADCVESLSSTVCKCVEGDAFKLFYRFQAQEGSGLVGVILTVIIYAALTCLSLVLVYTYLLHVHMNGRMLDVYRRVHAQETDLFIPHDCEVSLQELKTICEQAARWKGPRGTQRKVFVHDYVLQDPLDATFEEKSTHVALYNIELDGTRELYRHFLKSHDGTIIELFGEIGTGHDGSWQNDAGPGISSLALIYSILQDQHPANLESNAADLATLFQAL